MEFAEVWQWLEQTSIATAIRENDILFPWVESIHVLAIVLVVGSISIIDLRLLGMASLDRAVTRLTHEVLPYTWGAFIVAATTGLLLFSSKAATYAANLYFEWKMILLVLAGINMSIFHCAACRDIEKWDTDARIPLPARVAGAVSLLLWIVVVACGRWIGFTVH